MPAQTYLVEFVLKPTDKKYGNQSAEDTASLQADLQPDVPWTYSRSVVPDALARTGIGLESWRRAVDGANQIWKERTIALATAAQGYKQWCSIWAAVLLMLCYLLFPWVSPIVLFPGVVVLFSIMYWRFIHKYLEQLLMFEKKWSCLARELDEQYKPHGVTVETLRANVVKRHRNVAWTVGLVFSFRMQPASDDEIGWCIANSQSSGVEDDEYLGGKLRVTTESQWLQGGERPADVVDFVRGEESTMAVAIAVVDNDADDVVNSNQGDRVSEKRTLLDLV